MTRTALFTALLTPGIAMAGTYWVSDNGTAAWVDCEGATALDDTAACSMATANTNAAGGDTVFLRAGTYTGQTIQPAQSGDSDTDRIVFTRHADENVVIRDSPYGIYVYQQSYITIDGIDFVDLRRFFRVYASHYITIRYCTFDGRSADSGDWAGAIIADDPNDSTATSEDSTHNWVHHCSFFRWVYGAWDEHRGALLNLGSDQSAGDDSSFNLIEDNVFAYGGHHTLGVYSQHNVIRNNYIHNETNPTNWAFEGYRGAITEGPSAGRCLYQGNRFGFSDGSGLALRSPHNILRGNEFFHNGSGGIQVVTNNLANDQADYNHIYNNSFLHNGHVATYSGFQGGMYFTSWSGQSPVDNVVKNNIFYDSRNGSITYDGTVDPQVIENNWDDNATDPGFVDLGGTDPDDPARPDLHLAPSSTARDQGTSLTTITSASGAATSFTVADADYFMNGWGVIEGDLIQLAGTDQTARITNVDYATDTITVDTSLTFTAGQGIGLAWAGDAPDLGAFELPDPSNPDGGGEDGGPIGGDAGDGGADGDTELSPPGKVSGGCSCRTVSGSSCLLLLIVAGCRRSRERGCSL